MARLRPHDHRAGTSPTSAAIELAERGWLPDSLLRIGIRRLIAGRLREQERRGTGIEALLEQLGRGPIAVRPDKANEQHYELPPEFFALILGRHWKYSGCYWPEGVRDLDAAEEAMLRLTCERSGIEDGMEILDLGCGWGSLALWVAEQYPRCRVVAVSNSAPQGRHIASQSARRGIDRLEVMTSDVNDLQLPRRFDRVVSVEMFEHVRNYERLLARIAGWLRPRGKLFVHIFCHRRYAYLYEDAGAADWMARWFFTGGTMPSADLLKHFQDHLRLEASWRVDGLHYARTAESWLRNLDTNRAGIRALCEQVYGARSASRWVQRWRMFFMACAELFAFAGGTEWGVGHFLFGQHIDGLDDRGGAGPG